MQLLAAPDHSTLIAFQTAGSAREQPTRRLPEERVVQGELLERPAAEGSLLGQGTQNLRLLNAVSRGSAGQAPRRVSPEAAIASYRDTARIMELAEPTVDLRA